MHKVTIHPDIDPLKENRKLALEVMDTLERYDIQAFDILGSIGSGKTTLITLMADRIRQSGKKVGAILGDVAGNDDYKRLMEHDVPSVNVNTGKECHLDAHYVNHALFKLPLEEIDVLFVENVGNLVCPADFPLGAGKRLVVISITEGDDMVRKHPQIFAETEGCVLNKIDLAPYMDADIELVKADYQRVNPNGGLILTSAKTGEGIDELIEFLL